MALQRRPELDPTALTAEPQPPDTDLAVLDGGDDFDVETVSPSFSNRRPDPRLQRAARLAALDPSDGISL